MLQHIWILSAWLIPLIVVVECSWGSPGSGQYHIQTDEGPERYFRFQTDNGQFRKEKRLQDGTVIGTEAWIDAAGYLRQKDYIADKDGYRILKSKTVFVGKNRPIEDAIKSTKKVAPQSGILVDGKAGGAHLSHNAIPNDNSKHGGYVYSTTPLPVVSTTKSPIVVSSAAAEGKLNYLSPAEAAQIAPSPYLGFDHYPDELPRMQHFNSERQHSIYIRPNSEPIEQHQYDNDNDNDNNNFNINELGTGANEFAHTTTSRPQLFTYAPPPAFNLEAPLEHGSYRRRLKPIAVINVKPSPINGAAQPAPFAHAPTNNGYTYGALSSTPAYEYDGNVAVTTARPNVAILEVNNLDNVLLPPLPAESMHKRRLRPPSTIINNAENALDYDGVSRTRNGFRYYIPHQYHEEEEFGNEKRAGSYGYVDPFGIRRVVYYNASPERGFVHRNNNRYVGLNAKPYDPPGP